MSQNKLAIAAMVTTMAMLCAGTAWSHGNEARMVEFLNWKKIPNIVRVFGANRSHLEGSPSGSVRPQIRMIEGQSCIVGQVIGFDVDDRFAFDIDEPVELSVTYATAYTSPFVIGWDKSGGNGAGAIEITPQPGPTFTTAKVTLDRARLAGQATQGADIALGAPNGIVVCNIDVVRSNKTIAPEAYGKVKL